MLNKPTPQTSSFDCSQTSEQILQQAIMNHREATPSDTNFEYWKDGIKHAVSLTRLELRVIQLRNMGRLNRQIAGQIRMSLGFVDGTLKKVNLKPNRSHKSMEEKRGLILVEYLTLDRSKLSKTAALLAIANSVDTSVTSVDTALRMAFGRTDYYDVNPTDLTFIDPRNKCS